mgnify:CR=1 FL=1
MTGMLARSSDSSITNVVPSIPILSVASYPLNENNIGKITFFQKLSFGRTQYNVQLKFCDCTIEPILPFVPKFPALRFFTSPNSKRVNGTLYSASSSSPSLTTRAKVFPVYETKTNGSQNWGRIADNAWICIDYGTKQ